MAYDFAADKDHHPAWANYDGGSEQLERTSDLLLDPEREPSSNDPASGWGGSGQRINED